MFIILKYVIALVTVFAISWIPLIGAYDYEAALCVSLLGLIFIPIILPETEKDSRIGIVKTIGNAVIYWILANLSTLFVSLLRNELCHFEAGIIYQLLIALPSNLLAALCWGWIARLTKLKKIRIPVYLTFILADIGFALFALYNWPPLIAFGQFFGYFAGSIYDESIHVVQSLAFYRIGTLVFILCMIAAQTSSSSMARRIAMPLVGIAIAAGYHVFLAQTGITVPIGRQQTQDVLWMKVSSEAYPFTLHFQPKSKARNSLKQETDRLLSDFSKDYAYLKQFFQTEPPNPIDIYIYPTSELKGRLIGAERTSFARVWKNETHLVETAPDSSLARHEMAHLFASSFGNAPLGLAGGSFIPAMGWIEGLAMAAEWPIQTYNLHTWSEAILSHPEIFGEISPHQMMYAFWGLPSRVAYTLSGSYVHYLIDTYGIEKVKELSRHLPNSFEDIIQVGFKESFINWRSYLKNHHHIDKANILAPVVFGASSIWNKHCARYWSKIDDQYYDCLNDSFCSLQTLKELISMNTTPSCPLKQCRYADDDIATKLRNLNKLYSLYMMLGAMDEDQDFYSLYPMEYMNGLVGGIFSESLFEHKRQILSETQVPDNPTDMTAPQLRDYIYTYISHLDYTKDLPASAQIIWLERQADMLLHAKMYNSASLIYYIMVTQMTLPEGIARRIEIKSIAARYPQTLSSRAILQWFTTTNPDDYLVIPERDHDIQIIAYLDFVYSMSRRDFSRAKQAWTRLVLNLGETDPSKRITPRAWREVFRLLPYL